MATFLLGFGTKSPELCLDMLGFGRCSMELCRDIFGVLCIELWSAPSQSSMLPSALTVVCSPSPSPTDDLNEMILLVSCLSKATSSMESKTSRNFCISLSSSSLEKPNLAISAKTSSSSPSSSSSSSSFAFSLSLKKIYLLLLLEN